MKHLRFLLAILFLVTVQFSWGQNPGSDFFNPNRFPNSIDAAKRGDPKAQYEIAQCYEYGIGVTKNMNFAVYWYWKCADQDYSPGLNALGCCYFKGEGVQQDYIIAALLFKRAAEKGSLAGEVNYKGAKKQIEQSFP